jgi:predicted Zn-dependent protease with MMP-like domain
MNRARFSQMVDDVVDELPDVFRSRLGDVLFVIEDEPAPEELRSVGLDPERDTLFGLFAGTPLGERSLADIQPEPDRIVLYYRPLVRHCRTPWALRREIRTTVIHEVAHYFGMDEDEIAAEGYE